MKKMIAAVIVAGTLAGFAQDARSAYQQRQALAEVPRLVQEFGQLQDAQDALSARVGRLENASRSGDTQAEIAGVKAQMEQLKRDMNRMREEIVADISRRMADLMQKQSARAAYAAQSEAREQARTASRGRTGRRGTGETATETAGGGASASSASRTAAPSGPYYEHVVEAGQTLAEIAKGYGTTLKKVLAANPGIKPATLRVGQKIIVPAEEGKKK